MQSPQFKRNILTFEWSNYSFPASPFSISANPNASKKKKTKNYLETIITKNMKHPTCLLSNISWLFSDLPFVFQEKFKRFFFSSRRSPSRLDEEGRLADTLSSINYVILYRTCLFSSFFCFFCVLFFACFLIRALNLRKLSRGLHGFRSRHSQ